MENREKLTVMRCVRPEEKERVLTLVSDVFEIEQGIPRDMDDIPAEKSPQWWCIEISGRIVGGDCILGRTGRTACRTLCRSSKLSTSPSGHRPAARGFECTVCSGGFGGVRRRSGCDAENTFENGRRSDRRAVRVLRQQLHAVPGEEK